MKNKLILLAVGLAFVVLLAVATLFYEDLSVQYSPDALVEQHTPQTEDASKNTIPAPDFTVFDANGTEVHLSDFVGTPVVLNFWASWCGPCQSALGNFDSAAARYNGQIQFVMVNLTDGGRETVKTASTFLAEKGYTFPAFFDTKHSAAIAYNVSSIPATYLINAKGEIVARGFGPLDAATLEQCVVKLLAEN